MSFDLKLDEFFKLEEELIKKLQDLHVKLSHIKVIEGLFEQMKQDHRHQHELMKEWLF